MKTGRKRIPKTSLAELVQKARKRPKRLTEGEMARLFQANPGNLKDQEISRIALAHFPKEDIKKAVSFPDGSAISNNPIVKLVIQRGIEI